jgi:hypothetical protein
MPVWYDISFLCANHQFYAFSGILPDSAGPPAAGWSSPVGAAARINPIDWTSTTMPASVAGKALSLQAVCTGFVYLAARARVRILINSDDGALVLLGGGGGGVGGGNHSSNTTSAVPVSLEQPVGMTEPYWSNHGPEDAATPANVTFAAGWTPLVVRWFDSGGGTQLHLKISVNESEATFDGAGILFGM